MAKSSCPIHRWKLTRAWNLLSGQRARAYQRAWPGMVLHVILQKKEVTHVTVIEKEQDVINLVAPAFIDDKRVDIICADAMTYQPPAGVTYDVCWHDIWTYFSAENLQEMENLERKYLFLCKWQASGGMQECLNAFINSVNQSDA